MSHHTLHFTCPKKCVERASLEHHRWLTSLILQTHASKRVPWCSASSVHRSLSIWSRERQDSYYHHERELCGVTRNGVVASSAEWRRWPLWRWTKKSRWSSRSSKLVHLADGHRRQCSLLYFATGDCLGWDIEEVWGLPCGALDLELDAVEDAAREMHATLRTKWLASCTLSSTSGRWQACQHGIRSRRRAVTD